MVDPDDIALSLRNGGVIFDYIVGEMEHPSNDSLSKMDSKVDMNWDRETVNRLEEGISHNDLICNSEI